MVRFIYYVIVLFVNIGNKAACNIEHPDKYVLGGRGSTPIKHRLSDHIHYFRVYNYGVGPLCIPEGWSLGHSWVQGDFTQNLQIPNASHENSCKMAFFGCCCGAEANGQEQTCQTARGRGRER